MYNRLTITTNTKQIEVQTRRIVFSNRLLNAEIQRSVVPVVEREVIARLNQPAPPHRRPTLWQSPKQMRWWFAVGIRFWHGRTGKVLAWVLRTVFQANGGQMEAVNPVRYSRFVFQPPYKQRMHSVWLDSTRFVTQKSERIALLVADAWHRIGRRG